MPDRLKLFRDLNTAMNDVLDKSDSRKNEDLMAQMVDYQRVSQLRDRQTAEAIQRRDAKIKGLAMGNAALLKENAGLRESRTHATLKSQTIADQARGITNQNKLIARKNALCVELKNDNVSLRRKLAGQDSARDCHGWREAIILNQARDIAQQNVSLAARRKQYVRKVIQVGRLGQMLEDLREQASKDRVRAVANRRADGVVYDQRMSALREQMSKDRATQDRTRQDRNILDNSIISLRSDLREIKRLASPGRLPSTSLADLGKIHMIAKKG